MAARKKIEIPFGSKLNIGCGNQLKEGYINIDLKGRDRAITKLDGIKLPGVDPNFADTILAVHFIEHVPYAEAMPMFRRWQDVLIPGGTLVIESPDMDAMCRAYVDWKDNGWTEEQLLAFYGRREQPWKYWHPLFFGAQGNSTQQHCSFWSYEILRDALAGCRFSPQDIKQQDPVESKPGWGPSFRLVARKGAL